MTAPSAADLAELVRLPAVLSVPGDVLLGAVASGQARDLPRLGGLTAASCCLYLAGMALNDYADREVDAVERPGRPIPSGRVSPTFALGLAGGLTAAAGVLATAADGRRALAIAAPLAASVWAYDLALKQTPAGVVAMSACRTLDVLMGSGARRAPRALPAAALVGAHIATTTFVSRREVEGASPAVGQAALAATGAVCAASAAFASRRRPSRLSALVAAGMVGAYASVVGGAQARAAREPTPARLQQAVGAGIMGLVPLEAGLVAASGAPVPATALATLLPLGRRLSRRRTVT